MLAADAEKLARKTHPGLADIEKRLDGSGVGVLVRYTNEVNRSHLELP
jgi:hypothetical protein